MDRLLDQVVSSKKNSIVEKYTHKYLPTNKDKLEKIFEELVRYQPPVRTSGKKGHQSVRKVGKGASPQDYNSVEGCIKKSRSLIRSLQKKGIYSKPDDVDMGT